VVTICTTSLTFSSYTFCPHTVFVCFVWISEQRAIIFLYNINWLVFTTQAQCVYCAVWTGSLYTIQVNLRLWMFNKTPQFIATNRQSPISVAGYGPEIEILCLMTLQTMRSAPLRPFGAPMHGNCCELTKEHCVPFGMSHYPQSYWITVANSNSPDSALQVIAVSSQSSCPQIAAPFAVIFFLSPVIVPPVLLQTISTLISPNGL